MYFTSKILRYTFAFGVPHTKVYCTGKCQKMLYWIWFTAIWYSNKQYDNKGQKILNLISSMFVGIGECKLD